jgi:hypothetical protein
MTEFTVKFTIEFPESLNQPAEGPEDVLINPELDNTARHLRKTVKEQFPTVSGKLFEKMGNNLVRITDERPLKPNGIYCFKITPDPFAPLVASQPTAAGKYRNVQDNIYCLIQFS